MPSDPDLAEDGAGVVANDWLEYNLRESRLVPLEGPLHNEAARSETRGLFNSSRDVSAQARQSLIPNPTNQRISRSAGERLAGDSLEKSRTGLGSASGRGCRDFSTLPPGRRLRPQISLLMWGEDPPPQVGKKAREIRGRTVSLLKIRIDPYPPSAKATLSRTHVRALPKYRIDPYAW